MNTILYVRWSSAEQSAGSSKVRQLERCREHASVRGWKIVEEIIEEGVSAFTGGHRRAGKMSHIQARIEDGEFKDGVVLLVENLDRLSREEPKKVFTWLEQITSLGVIVATVEGDRQYRQDNLDMATIIELVVKADLAHRESLKKSERITASWDDKRARILAGENVILTSRAPAWLLVGEGRKGFKIIADRAQVVVRIFEETAQGFGKHHIARRLNEEEVPTFGKSQAWHASYIQKILNNVAVLGEFQLGKKSGSGKRSLVGDPIKNYYPAIISADLYARARVSMQDKARLNMGQGRRLANLFSGLAYCAGCGAKMTLRSKGQKKRADSRVVYEDYLVCDAMQRGIIQDHGGKCKNNVRFNYSSVEQGVLNAILSDAVGDAHFAAPRQAANIAHDCAIAKLELERLRARADSALETHISMRREETLEKYKKMIELFDAQEGLIAHLNASLVQARGAVSPDEHAKRIEVLRNEIHSSDENVRFPARSIVRVAISELVEKMSFHHKARRVGIRFKSGVRTVVIDAKTTSIALDFYVSGRRLSREGLSPRQLRTIKGVLQKGLAARRSARREDT
ncbi:MAG: recombinase family protein [Blastomonas sp.]|nr:recombinase family protein [Blastomonas sp.]MDM7955930.1 recombinase family protein [Blastomonas sp.]